VDTDTAGMTPDNAATQTHQERSYPLVDCVGSYLWIWERLVWAEGSAEVVAREVHRDRPPPRCDR
jgi:hypothetical protein